METKSVTPMIFTNGSVESNAQITSGIVCLDQLKENETKLQSIEELKRCGLSVDEIKLYCEYQNGFDHLQSVYKNHERSSLLAKIEDINRRLETVEKSRAPSDPIDRLNEIKEDIFGHLEVDKYPTASKRRKLMRRMERKMNREAPLPEPACKSEHPDSKWDKKVWQSIKVVEKRKTVCANRQIGCLPSPKAYNKMYTIRNNTIVKLKSESKYVDGTKLCIQDIKSIPKFKDYDPGTPAKVLFVKNLSNNIREEDLEKVFEDQEYTNIRVMSGKMKGQAFVTFDTIESASKSLEQINGRIVKGKPIICVFSKRLNK